MNYAEIITETNEELKRVEKKQKLVQFQSRLRFLFLLKTGAAHTQAAAGAEVGWQLRQSQKVWGLYRRGGLAAVLRPPRGWGFGKLSSHQLARLHNYTAQFGAESLQEVRDYLEQTCGVSYTIGGVSALCARLKIKLKTARPANALQDAVTVAAYKKTSGS
jgi:transposase